MTMAPANMRSLRSRTASSPAMPLRLSVEPHPFQRLIGPCQGGAVDAEAGHQAVIATEIGGGDNVFAHCEGVETGIELKGPGDPGMTDGFGAKHA